jgi:hypothetical protein
MHIRLDRLPRPQPQQIALVVGLLLLIGLLAHLLG